MHRFFHLNKIFWRILFTKISLLLALISFFLLLTAFAGAVLVMDYDCSMLIAAAICLAPWLVAIIVLFVIYSRAQKCYEQEKEELLDNSRNAFITRVILYLIQFIMAKRKKRKEQAED